MLGKTDNKKFTGYKAVRGEANVSYFYLDSLYDDTMSGRKK